MHHAPRREDGRADRHFGPDIVLEELGASLQHKKPFVLVQVIMRRRASARRSDNGKHGIFAAGFRSTEVNGNLVTKSSNDFTVRWRNDAGGWSGLFVIFVFVGLQDMNRDFDDTSMPPNDQRPPGTRSGCNGAFKFSRSVRLPGGLAVRCSAVGLANNPKN